MTGSRTGRRMGHAVGVAVLEADRPLPERRDALDRVLNEVCLSPGGVHITCGMGGRHYHAPYGPPWGGTGTT